MAIIQTLTTSFKVEVAQALHNFTTGTGNVFKLALYTANADLGASTTAYTTAGESSGTNYTAGGIVLTNITPAFQGTTSYWSFETATFTNVSLTTNGALIYNSTNGNRSVAVLNFGVNITKTAQNLVITFPANDATNAVLRIA
ncbi:MAG: hypothetical protein EBZ06_12925 [Betaproteobacteria bacterium]|nr:hypothetical protein [Betaproteobacteria bacterium]